MALCVDFLRNGCYNICISYIKSVFYALFFCVFRMNKSTKGDYKNGRFEGLFCLFQDSEGQL